MTGMQSFDRKEKRAMRRRNHIARDLADEKYRQRVINPKRRKYPVTDWELDDE